jgi:hypothetical protein
MKARGVLGVLVCALALALPATAAAKPGYFVSDGGFSISARLPKSNGYTVSLYAQTNHLIEVALERRGEIALYFARGRANRHGIDVDLGRFGRVHASFRGHRAKSEFPFSGCHARPSIGFDGHLEGTFRFRGEGGFADVKADRVRASYQRSFKETCYSGPVEGGPDGSIEILEARGRMADGELIWFSAARLDDPNVSLVDEPDVPFINASTRGRVGRVSTLKITSTFENRSHLQFNPPNGDPETVSVSPGSPFHGTATYDARPDAPGEWTGDLRVPFAGLGMVPLTGPSFHANACHVRRASSTVSCERQEQGARSAAIAQLWLEQRR